MSDFHIDRSSLDFGSCLILCLLEYLCSNDGSTSDSSSDEEPPTMAPSIHRRVEEGDLAVE